MARGINKVILIGNLGHDPDVRYSQSGTAVCTIRLATAEGRKDAQTGEWQDHTEWHSIVLLGRTAEIAKEYLRKGSKIYVEGRLQTRKYIDKNNIERYQTEVVANDMQMLSGKNSGAPFDDYGQGGGAPREYAPREQDSRPATPRPQPMPESNHDAGFDDDVPF